MFDVDMWQTALQQLNGAIDGHEQWHSEFTRTVVCRLPPDGRDVAEEAHRACCFGQWYYGEVPQDLRGHAAFAALESDHERMHRLAAQLLRASASGRSVSPSDYDDFARTLLCFRRGIYSLRSEIEDSLHGHDPLTNAESRIGMLSRLREALELVKRRTGQCCIAIMDLDHFKAINDTHGHRVGDQVLVATVRHARERLRPYDRVFRYGGDEFLILMPSTGVQDGLVVIERLRSEYAAAPLIHDGGKAISVTASFGIAPIDPDVSPGESIDRADNAMYAAKTEGRNRVFVWDPRTTPRKRP